MRTNSVLCGVADDCGPAPAAADVGEGASMQERNKYDR